ncbi:hypothetical protein CROQUDRAFT_219105 [Cronartium quercuum f. sp. fusiforme G11]|uniref:Uncharacterized protein n=1 Tax=Cronartium quercuum f. sp. fusiforme G11 TaxID=708437 RepID=A0A9P6NB93_9BASI|nr:hypothetical protein CROQUDRAFT_219105 [Cronartium quercuum f. sp. fusiforme G11]
MGKLSLILLASYSIHAQVEIMSCTLIRDMKTGSPKMTLKLWECQPLERILIVRRNWGKHIQVGENFGRELLGGKNPLMFEDELNLTKGVAGIAFRCKSHYTVVWIYGC